MSKNISLSSLLTLDLSSCNSVELPRDKVDSGSITPSTHKSRKNLDFAMLQTTQGSVNSLDIITGNEFFIDRFSYDNTKSEVLRYGIDSSSIKVDTSVSITSNEAMVLGEKINFSTPSSIASKSGASKDKQAASKKIKHHNLEKLVFKEAVNYLLNDTHTNTILVHIFERDEDSLIKLNTSNQIKTHTVLLYKNPEVHGKHEILVIDPNNPTFSLHLSNDDMKKSIEVHPKLDSIKTTTKLKEQIYKAGGTQGSNAEQFRDCLDIAVKLAFGLKSAHQLDVDEISQYPVIKALSNNAAINESLPFSASKGFVKNSFRAQHKSNIEVGMKLYQLSIAAKQKIADLDDTNPIKGTLNKKHDKIIGAQIDFKAALDSLFTLADESFTARNDELVTEQRQLGIDRQALLGQQLDYSLFD